MEWYGIVQAFGTNDGAHITISYPKANSQDYFCYKQYHSINAQAIFDDKCLFMDADCGWPGSVHESKIYITLQSIEK